MKPLIIIISLIILTACSTKPGDKTIDESKSDSLTSKQNTQRQSTAIYNIDTLQINGRDFIQIAKGNKFNCLLTLTGDTIVKSTDFYSQIKFLDIDEDGYRDIRVFAFSNTPNQCDNYLFDKAFNTFRKVQNSDLDIVKIRNTKYFYSYNRAGCADLDWESHLIKIENWKEIDIGLMSVKSCGDKGDGIKIYKINNGTDTKLVRTFPIITFDNNGANNKWAYLKNYWTKNYAAFD